MAEVVIFRGSPRLESNTHALEEIVRKQLEAAGHVVVEFDPYDMDIQPCIACRCCQEEWEYPGCVQQDDMGAVFHTILRSDLLILATPVYSWYCTPPAKALLDRMVYALCKYYGSRRGPSLLAKKGMALITTCGYPTEKGADLLEEGIRRYCKHAQLGYRGMLCEHHEGYGTVFLDEDKRKRAEAFGAELVEKLEDYGR